MVEVLGWVEGEGLGWAVEGLVVRLQRSVHNDQMRVGLKLLLVDLLIECFPSFKVSFAV